MSKRKRREPMDKEDTAADDSPFRPTGGVTNVTKKKAARADPEVTAPGLPAKVLESMSDSVEAKDTLSPFAPDELPAPSDVPTNPRVQTPKAAHPESDKATQVAHPPKGKPASKEAKKPEPKAEPPLARSTQPIDRKRKKPARDQAPTTTAPEMAPPTAPAAAPPMTTPAMAPPADTVSPKLLELSAKLDQQINTTLDAVGALHKGIEETDTHRQELLSEAKTVNRNYKQLVEKIVTERDALSKELSHVRSQYAADAKKQAQAFTDLQRDLEKERRENERKLREAEDEVGRQNQRITELETQLAEAMASRDRIADRVRQVETNLEQSILPLREELDQARGREAQARTELDGANKEIAALKLLAAGPPSR